MSSDVNLGITMEGFQVFDLRYHSSLDSFVANLEAIVYLALLALGIGDLIDGQIDDPVFDVAASPKGKDDGVEIRGVSGEALDVCRGVREGFWILKSILSAFLAVPSVDTGHALIGNRGVVG